MTCEAEENVGRLTGAGAKALKASDQRVIVVGAGGWLGLATLELLHRLLGSRAFHTRVVAFGSNGRLLELRNGLCVVQRPLTDLARLEPAPSLVLHLAFLTQEKAKAMSAQDYVQANRAISRQVLDSLDQIGAIGVFVPSSGAVYRVDDPGAEASLRLYGRLKLEDEAAFSGWAKARGKRAVIARVFNLSGPYINKQSSYALACFIADAMGGRPIQIKATRPVYRSFVAISELMSVALGALVDKATGGVTLFDTAGDEALEMGQIAAFVKHALNASGDVERLPLDSSLPDRYLGDRLAYRALRAQFGVAAVDFLSQIKTTAAYMSGSASKGSRMSIHRGKRSAAS